MKEGLRAVIFRFKKKLKVSYQKQGYIHFFSHNYKKLSAKEKNKIDKLCSLAGGEYSEALKRYMTTDVTDVQVCLEYYISKATLYRCVDKYIKLFADII